MLNIWLLSFYIYRSMQNEYGYYFCYAMSYGSVFILYLITSSLVNHQYDNIINQIWNHHHHRHDNNSYFLYLNMTLKQYPIKITIGKLVVTTSNVFKFIALFCIAKYISYSLKAFDFY